MVKGNEERRRELAKARCEEKKMEKERKLGGPAQSTPGEARGRILSDAMIMGTVEGIYGWVTLQADEEQGGSEECMKRICTSHFRNGHCDTRRCKFSHSVSIGEMVKGVPEFGGQEDGSLPPLRRQLLRDCPIGGQLVYDRTLRRPIRQESPLIFIEDGTSLLFDSYNPDVFVDYCSSQQKREEGKKLQPVKGFQEGKDVPDHTGCDKAGPPDPKFAVV